ncbi:hypothetical protein [Rufibacter sp. DG15C]|uniref:hypothetical protein n=1 Tax=Rufibacter sp. DG15C TaxID=1379909 RepID=UPI000830BCE7|nr:hypothetical protein [Rufibacter sp. DG15C]
MKDMQVKEFVELPLVEQIKQVQDQGRYLHSRLKGWCHISLYGMGSFYAEVWLLEHCGSIALVRTFTSQKQLDPYLQTTCMENFLKQLAPSE